MRRAGSSWVVAAVLLLSHGEQRLALAVDGAQPSAHPVQQSIAVKGGKYVPLFRGSETEGRSITVDDFLIDARPVTQSEFLEFVRTHPEWRRSARTPIFADETYLSSWSDDLAPGGAPDAPVTEVSWFAAKAFCKASGKRLPAAAEWEYVARASETEQDGTKDKRHLDRILEWYGKPATASNLRPVGIWKNYWGVYDLHGLVWEWVSDFNSELTTGESRADTDMNRNLFCGAGALAASEKDRANYAAFMRYAFRGSLRGTYTLRNLGFRCAMSPIESRAR